MSKRYVHHFLFCVIAVATWVTLSGASKEASPPIRPKSDFSVQVRQQPVQRVPAQRVFVQQEPSEPIASRPADDGDLTLELPPQGTKVLDQVGNRALVHIDMRGRDRLILELQFSGPSREWSLNLGDSNTNNGWGGDGCTAINDAELQILNGVLELYGSDLLDTDPDYGYKVRFMKRWENVIGSDGKLRLEVADGKVTYLNSEGRRETFEHYALFALAGQPDREAGVNYDLYLGVNRVVAPGRTGSGISKVKISFES